jgi:hypothetical protein
MRLALPLLLAAASASAQFAANELDYIGRIGLTGADYTGTGGLQKVTSSFPNVITSSGFTSYGLIAGTSAQYNGGSTQIGNGAWIADTLTATTRQVGLFSGSEFTNSSGGRTSEVNYLSSSLTVAGQAPRYFIGSSYRYNGGSDQLGQVAWIYDWQTDTTTRLGLTGSDTLNSQGAYYSSFSSNNVTTTVGGTTYLLGSNLTYRVVGNTNYSSGAVWLHNLGSGTAARIGLTTGDFAMTGSDFGPNTVELGVQSGKIVGRSSLLSSGKTYDGTDSWVYDIAGGTYTMIGLRGGLYEAVPNTSLRNIAAATFQGKVAGTTDFYENSAYSSHTWAYDIATDTTYQIGLMGAAYEGWGSSSGNGQRIIGTRTLRNAAGEVSHYFHGSAGTSNSTSDYWVHDVATGVNTALVPTGDIYTLASGLGTANLGALGGWTAVGSYNNVAFALASTYTLVNDARTATAFDRVALLGWTPELGVFRMGLFSGPEFVSSSGAVNTSQPFGGSMFGLLESEAGWHSGTSNRYNGGVSQVGQAAWLASLVTGQTYRVGLWNGDDGLSGNEFTSSTGVQSSAFTSQSATRGTSDRYNGGATQLGQATWVKLATTGTIAAAHATAPVTARVGLWNGGDGLAGNEFTHADGTQVSAFAFSFSDGVAVIGTSNRYNGGSTQLGQAAWVADRRDGSTLRVGLTDDLHTADNGTQSSTLSAAQAATTESGLILWGTSVRYDGDSAVGQTAWYRNTLTNFSQDIAIDVRESDGYSFNTISGAATRDDEFMLYGTYERLDNAGVSLGTYVYLWSQTGGVVELDIELGGFAADDVTATAVARYLNNLDTPVFIGSGLADGVDGSTSNWIVAVGATPIPEPSTYGLILGGLALAGAAVRRRMAKKAA